MILLAAPVLAQSTDVEYFERIDSLRELSKYQQVMEMLQERRQSNSDNPEVLWRLGQTHVDIGELAESSEVAEEHYATGLELGKQAIELAPNSAHAHLTVAIAQGRVALSSGTQRKVELSRGIKEHVDRAIELDPTLDLAYHVRGRWHYEIADLGWFTNTIVKVVYGGMPDASFEKAASDFRRAIEIRDRVAHRLKLAEAYIKMGQEDQARAQLRRAIDMPLDMEEARKYQEEARQLLREIS